MKEKTPIDNSNIDPNYWEGILEQNNLGRVTFISKELKKNGLEGTSLEGAQETEYTIKEQLSNAITFENEHSGAFPLNKVGAPPCGQKDLQIERSSTIIDTNFENQ